MPTQIALLAVLSLAVACQRAPVPPPTPPRSAESPATVVVAADLPADVSAAFDQLQGQLKQRLLAEIARGGPEAAIDICKMDAAQLTAAQSTPQLRVGRTSIALRNPVNQPPRWAAHWVLEQGRRKVADGPKLASVPLPGGGMGYLRAIGTAPVCLACHGAQSSLTGGLRARLAQAYSKDTAVDFAEGDVRGWFWAEKSAESKK